MTPNSPVDGAGGWRWRPSWDGDGDDGGGGDADVGGNLGPTTKKTVASVAVAAPGGGGVGDVPPTADVAGAGGRLPARNRRNRKWTRSSRLVGGTWRRSRVTTVPGGPPLDHLW